MKYYKCPRLFTVDVDENKVVVNSRNLKWDVFDRLQIKVLEAFRDGCDVNTVAEKLDIPQAYIERVVELLLPAEFLKKTADFPVPDFRDPPEVMSVWVQTSNICNLKCSYCYTKKNKDQMSDTVWLQFKKKILQTACQRKLKRVTLRLGGGEPTLTLKNYAHHLEEIKNDLSKLGCELGIILITNLTVATSEMVEFVKRMDCSVSVSLDGLGEFHDTSRMFKNGDGSFNV
ncbi:hypothetical protein COT95_00270, partial [Candidatus Falkowbacteria bacterium CG10_big_fil_rev_8_21_14_0_10_37_6]